MNEKNSNSTIKDEKILNLERTIHTIREDQCKQETKKEELRKKIKEMRTKNQELESDKEFYYKQLMEEKKKNKLLKLAIGRMQMELDKPSDDKVKVQSKGDTFLTDLLHEGTAASV